jgi:hypothetical protein
MFTKGQKVWTPEQGWAKFERVLIYTPEFSYVTTTGGKMWRVATETIAENAPDGVLNQHRINLAAKKIAAYVPMDIAPETLATFRNLHCPPVSVRFSWPRTADAAVHTLFESLGIELHKDARPMDSGKFGGQPMYGLSSETYGLEDFDIPEKGTLPFALKLAKEGFPVHVATTL